MFAASFFDPVSLMQDAPGESIKNQSYLGFDLFADNSLGATHEESKMDLEETYTEDTNSNKAFSQKEAEKDENPKDNHSKDCLKFCRKVARFVPEQLLLKKELIREIINLNATVLASFLNPLDLRVVDSSRLEDIQIEILLKLWTSFKAVLSYKKNKKICIVKQEYWDLIFEKKTATNVLKDHIEEFSKTWKDLEVRNLLKSAAFSEILSRMLFCTNKTIILTLILRDASSKALYIRNLRTIDSFLLMVIYPGFFQYYNNRSGKFAVECCGKCKICRSKAVPMDFLEQLGYARLQVELVMSQINKIFTAYAYDLSGAMTHLMELSFNNF